MQIEKKKFGFGKKGEDSQESDFAPFFGDLSQSEKLSEIRPPLNAQYCTQITVAM